MELNEYQKLALRTANKTKTFQEQFMGGGLGISGESGEVADYIKKVFLHDHPLNKDKVIKEIGDVLWYIAFLADLCETTLEEVAATNIEKLAERYPNGFESERSLHRGNK